MPDIPPFGPFALLDKTARERLGANATPRALKQDETLIEERDASDDAFLILDGSVRVLARGERRTLAIVGVGGVSTGWDATELLLAGASAVQVGTATFADPRAALDVLAALS